MAAPETMDTQRRDRRPLFLFDAHDGRWNGWAAQAHLPRNMSLSVAAWLSVAALLAAAIYLVLGQYTRLVRAEGVMLPAGGLTRLTSPSGGWIRRRTVRDGDEVRKGDVLYTLCMDHITEHGGVNQAGIHQLRLQRQEIAEAIERQQVLAAVEKRQLSAELDDARHEQVHLEAYGELLGKFTAELERNALRQEQLIARGLATLGQVETRQQAHMSYQLQVESTERERLRLRARIHQLEHQLKIFDRKAESRLGELRQRLAEIDRQVFESEGRREIQIVAPRDGLVTAVMAEEGQTVQAGYPLLTIVPGDTRLLGHLLVSDSGIGFIRRGDTVLMRYQAFPYQKYGQFPGRIVSISRSTLSQDDLSALVPGGAGGAAGSLYLVTVEPDQPALNLGNPLQPGMHFEAHVRTETRRLYEWLLNPLSRVAGKVAEF